MDVEFKEATLDNGLRVVAEVNPGAHTAAAGIFVRTGARDEAAEQMGVSHFMEHMVFKGTDRWTAEAVNAAFDRMGARHNAATGPEATMFWAHVLPDALPDALDLLAELMRPALREEDFEVERKVILEEIGMYADRPGWRILEQALALYFDDHPLGFRILGTQETVGNLRADQMRAYYEARYGPDNIVVSLAGAIDWEGCVEQIKRHFGDWQPTGAERDTRPPRPADREERATDSNLSRYYEMVLTPGPAAQDDQRYAAAVAANLLGDSDGSRAYWKLVDPGLADDVTVGSEPFDRCGAFIAMATCHPDVSDRVEGGLLEVLDQAAEELSEDEVERARNKIAMDLTLQSERPAGRMMSLGHQIIETGERRSLREELDRIRSVDVDEIQGLLRDYPFRPRAVASLGPQ